MTERLLDLPVKIFADGADLQGIADLYRQPYIQGLTTNPTLMRKVGLTDYESFARAVLKEVKSKPISFEVFSDDFSEMRRQALKIHDWQDNVYVKIPITNTNATPRSIDRRACGEGVKLNITAMLTPRQVKGRRRVEPDVPAIVSVFAGESPTPGSTHAHMKESLEILQAFPKPNSLGERREVLNVFQAAACGCDIVTVPHDILKKLLNSEAKTSTNSRSIPSGCFAGTP